MTLVVDASAVVEFVLGSTKGRKAAVVMAAHTALHAPALITAEALRALRAGATGGNLPRTFVRSGV